MAVVIDPPAASSQDVMPLWALNALAVAFAAAGFGLGVMVGRDAGFVHQTAAAAGAATAYAEPLFFASLTAVWLGR